MTRDAYHGAPDPPAHEHAWTRVYRRADRTAHIRELIRIAHPDAPATWDESEGWYGTGSQQEYDRAKTLPSCAQCFLIKVQYEHDPPPQEGSS